MSISKVLRQSVHCDACGAQIETEEPTAYAARIHAGIKGWRFAVGRRRENGQKGRREFDYCPDCWPTSPHATGEL